MNYFIKRELQEYGPYSLAELQRYVGTGNVLLTDLCRSEGMDQWIPVSQVIGNIAVPVAAPAPAAAYAAPQPSPYPPPPSLHWGIVLLLGIVTCGLFAWAWAIVQAVWLRKVQPNSKALLYWCIAVGLLVVWIIASSWPDPEVEKLSPIFFVAGIVTWLVAAFNAKNGIEEHYNVAEPLGLTLSGVMTFFFNVYYFQYHFTRINDWKRSQGQII